MNAPTTEVETAILLMGYGSPGGSEDLSGYLTDVLHGRRPSAAMVEEYRRRFALIGGSPQNRIIASLRSKLERHVTRARPGIGVYLGTKHWKPNIAEVLPQISQDGFRRVLAIPLSPYASTWILEPYRAALEKGRRAAGRPLEIEFRTGWNLNPHLIDYWSRSIQRELAQTTDPAQCVFLSAHSLPKRYHDRGDPYADLLAVTSGAIAKAARLDRWTFTYQSAGNTTEAWLGPDITELMVKWKGQGASTQIVASFGFIFDHLEVLYDLDIVVKQFANEHGIAYRRVPMPNDGDEMVEALADVALRSDGASRFSTS